MHLNLSTQLFSTEVTMDAHVAKFKPAIKWYTGSGTKDLKGNQSFESHQET